MRLKWREGKCGGLEGLLGKIIFTRAKHYAAWQRPVIQRRPVSIHLTAELQHSAAVSELRFLH